LATDTDISKVATGTDIYLLIFYESILGKSWCGLLTAPSYDSLTNEVD